jgi:hypothetical protein
MVASCDSSFGEKQEKRQHRLGGYATPRAGGAIYKVKQGINSQSTLYKCNDAGDITDPTLLVFVAKSYRLLRSTPGDEEDFNPDKYLLVLVI